MGELDDQDSLYDVLRRIGFYFVICISFRYLKLNGFVIDNFLYCYFKFRGIFLVHHVSNVCFLMC